MAPLPDPVNVPSQVAVAPPAMLTTAPDAATYVPPVLVPPPLRLSVPVSAFAMPPVTLLNARLGMFDDPVPAVLSRIPALLKALGSVRFQRKSPSVATSYTPATRLLNTALRNCTWPESWVIVPLLLTTVPVRSFVPPVHCQAPVLLNPPAPARVPPLQALSLIHISEPTRP